MLMSFKMNAVFRVYLLLDILPRDFQLLEKRAYWENGLKWNRNDRHSIYFHSYYLASDQRHVLALPLMPSTTEYRLSMFPVRF